MKEKNNPIQIKQNSKFITYVVIAFAIIGLMLSCLIKQNVIKKEVLAIDEIVEGRIDLTTTPYTNESNFEVYNSNSLTPEKESSWMPKYNTRGYSLEKNGNENTFTIKIVHDADITIALRGRWELKNPENKEEGLKENWVDFTSVTINGEEILPETTAVWHNKPFKYIINAKAGETYAVVARWKKHVE